MMILGGFGLITGDEVTKWEESNPGQLFQQSETAILGVRICITFVPIVFALVSLYLLNRFQMNKKEHSFLRAAVATKHKNGSIALDNEQITVVEKITGQKYENTWLGKDNAADAEGVELNANGEYQILIDIENEMKKIRTSKEGKKAEAVKADA